LGLKLHVYGLSVQMDNKSRPLKVYITTNLNNAHNEKDYTTKDKSENNPQWGEKYVFV
jgi:hypothetical protein